MLAWELGFSMPKYRYECNGCHLEIQKYISYKVKTIECPECQAVMNRQMPRLSGLRNTETVDKFTNKKHIDNHEEILKERKADHYWEVIVPDMVNSGTYTIETMIEQNWVYYNEKGELTTRTKPPQKG